MDPNCSALVGATLTAVEREASGHPWYFHFGPHGSLMCESLWRLLNDGRVSLASSDDNQLFGHQEPVDCLQELQIRLLGRRVTAVSMAPGPADLEIALNSGDILQCIVDSSGYESWSLTCGKRTLFTHDGGRLNAHS